MGAGFNTKTCPGGVIFPVFNPLQLAHNDIQASVAVMVRKMILTSTGRLGLLGLATCFMPGSLAMAQEKLWQFNTSGHLTAAYDDNIEGNPEGEGATSLRGGIMAEYSRKVAFAMLGVRLDASHVTYFDRDDLNNTDIVGEFSFSPSVGTQDRDLSYSMDLGYNQKTDVDPVAGERIETEEWLGALQVDYVANRRWGAGFGVNYSRIIPDDPDLLERSSLGVDLSFSYRRSSKSSLLFKLGATQTSSDDAGASESESYTASAGFSGQLFPKLTGTLQIGMQHVSTEGTDTQSPFADVQLLWAINDLNNLRFTVQKQFSASSLDLTTESLVVSLQYSRTLNRRLQGSLGVAYTENQLDSVRLNDTQENVLVTASLAYKVNDWLSLSWNNSWSDQDSRLQRLNYQRLRTSLTLSAKW